MDPAILAAVMNGGALVILGYHLLWGLPKMLQDMMAAQSAERTFWAQQNSIDRSAFAERAKLIADALARREAEIDARAEARAKHGTT